MRDGRLSGHRPQRSTSGLNGVRQEIVRAVPHGLGSRFVRGNPPLISVHVVDLWRPDGSSRFEDLDVGPLRDLRGLCRPPGLGQGRRASSWPWACTVAPDPTNLWLTFTRRASVSPRTSGSKSHLWWGSTGPPRCGLELSCRFGTLIVAWLGDVVRTGTRAGCSGQPERGLGRRRTRPGVAGGNDRAG